jgi:hypothetical protein
MNSIHTNLNLGRITGIRLELPNPSAKKGSTMAGANKGNDHPSLFTFGPRSTENRIQLEVQGELDVLADPSRFHLRLTLDDRARSYGSTEVVLVDQPFKNDQQLLKYASSEDQSIEIPLSFPLTDRRLHSGLYALAVQLYDRRSNRVWNNARLIQLVPGSDLPLDDLE